RRVPARQTVRRRSSRPARRAVLLVHGRCRLLRRPPGARAADPVYARRRDRPPPRPLGGGGARRHPGGLPPQPPRVLRKAPPRDGAVSPPLPPGSRITGLADRPKYQDMGKASSIRVWAIAGLAVLVGVIGTTAWNQLRPSAPAAAAEPAVRIVAAATARS